MKTKSTLLATAILSATLATAQTGRFFAAPTDSIRVSGTIHYYKPSADNNYINVYTHDLAGRPESKAVKINPDGSFETRVFQAYEGDMQLHFKPAYFELYVVPGKHLEVDLYLGKAAGEASTMTAKGELAEMSNLSLRFQSALRDQILAPKPKGGDKSLTDSAFVALSMIRLREQLAFLDRFVAANQASETFRAWQINKLQYGVLRESFTNPFLGKINRTILPRQLAALAGGIPVENPSALKNWEYYASIERLSSAIQIIGDNNPAFEASKKRNGQNALPVFLDMADSLSSGISRQLIYLSLTNMALSAPEFVAPFRERIDGVIREPYLRNAWNLASENSAKRFKPVEMASKLINAPLSTRVKERLTEILTSKTAIFMDFWGEWCAPCMAEIPSYPGLISALKDKPIKFLFLSTYTPEARMLAIKKQYGIDAEFINLSNDDAAVLNTLLGFSSYPAHFLLNASGLLLSRDPGSPKSELTPRQIGKLLQWP